jgi:hypothetical protein
MTGARVTMGQYGGRLWIIKKGGVEITYANTKAEAKKKADAIRAGTYGR